MESADNETSNDISHGRYRLSWVAYVRIALVFLFLLTLAVVLGLLYQPQIAALAVLIILMACAYEAFYLRSIILFTDDNGVWLFRGILPWNKGVIGVQWRDIDCATYITGFTSWAFNSYSIRIGHRFTKTSELVVPNIKDGRNVVAHINGIHKAKLEGFHQVV